MLIVLYNFSVFARISNFLTHWSICYNNLMCASPKYKYCIECGERILMSANYCSSCGLAQGPQESRSVNEEIGYEESAFRSRRTVNEIHGSKYRYNDAGGFIKTNTVVGSDGKLMCSSCGARLNDLNISSGDCPSCGSRIVDMDTEQ